jgi:hypothetical protein
VQTTQAVNTMSSRHTIAERKTSAQVAVTKAYITAKCSPRALRAHVNPVKTIAIAAMAEGSRDINSVTTPPLNALAIMAISHAKNGGL